MKTIKTKETDHHISTLDKKQDTKFFDKKKDISEKKNEDELEETNSQRYAVNKVVNRGKIYSEQNIIGHKTNTIQTVHSVACRVVIPEK